jgi:hypothetical protein
MATKAKKDNGAKVQKIDLQKLDIRVIRLTLVGDTPLIVKRFGEKAREAMEKKQVGGITNPTKELRIPEEECEACKYKTRDGRDGIPASGIKNAMLTATRATNKKVTKTFLSQAVHVLGDIIPLRGSAPRMRDKDIGKVGIGKTPMPIYRPEYEKWEVDVDIKYNAAIINPSLIVNLLDLAGFGVGLHEWRPEKRGTNGMFHVKQTGGAK